MPRRTTVSSPVLPGPRRWPCSRARLRVEALGVGRLDVEVEHRIVRTRSPVLARARRCRRTTSRSPRSHRRRRRRGSSGWNRSGTASGRPIEHFEQASLVRPHRAELSTGGAANHGADEGMLPARRVARRPVVTVAFGRRYSHSDVAQPWLIGERAPVEVRALGLAEVNAVVTSVPRSGHCGAGEPARSSNHRRRFSVCPRRDEVACGARRRPVNVREQPRLVRETRVASSTSVLVPHRSAPSSRVPRPSPVS